jgi:hypothetical protein
MSFAVAPARPFNPPFSVVFPSTITANRSTGSSSTFNVRAVSGTIRGAGTFGSTYGTWLDSEWLSYASSFWFRAVYVSGFNGVSQPNVWRQITGDMACFASFPETTGAPWAVFRLDFAHGADMVPERSCTFTLNIS